MDPALQITCGKVSHFEVYITYVKLVLEATILKYKNSDMVWTKKSTCTVCDKYFRYMWL